MKKLHAKVLAVLMALIMAAGLAGCGRINIIGLAIPAMAELVEGDTGALEVSYSADREDAADEAVLEAAGKLALEWTSSDAGIAAVDENGNVTAVSGGEAVITVKAGEMESSCKVTVKVPLKALEADGAMALYINGLSPEDGYTDTKQLDAQPIPANADGVEITFTSADESIATVDEKGVVTAVSNGSTIITASAVGVGSADGVKTETEVTVCTMPAFITLDDAVLTVGRSGKLNVTVDAENVTFTDPIVNELTFESSDEDIVQVDGDGVVSALAVGEAAITVTNGTGLTATATITVNPAPVVRPASNNTSTSGGGANGGGTDSAGSGGSSGGSAVPESTPAAGANSGVGPYVNMPCTRCGSTWHIEWDCPNVYHYHGNGYDEGVCPGCSTIYCAYLAGPDAFRPEGPGFE